MALAKEEYTDMNFLTRAKAISVVLPADPNQKDANGDTPLHLALRTGFASLNYLTMYATLDHLLNAGANPAFENKQGQTPLRLLDHMVAEIEADENEPYLKAREHALNRVHLGVLHTVRCNLFQPL